MNETQELLPSARRLKFPAVVEKDFLEDYFRNSIGCSRAALLLGLALYAAFGILDFWGLPSREAYAWRIRYMIVCPIITTVFLLSWLPAFKKCMQQALLIMVLSAGLGIIAMIAVSQPRDPGYAHYYAGLILVIVFGFTYLRLRLRFGLAAAGIIVAAYEWIAIFYQRILDQPEGLRLFLNSNFFLVASCIIGTAAGYFLEFYMRKEFLHRRVIESELLSAREIQQSMLPKDLPGIPGLSVAGACRTSRHVGGDHFDILPAGNGEWLFVIADVSGKGAAAALMMANLHAMMRMFPANQELLESAAIINDQVHNLMRQKRYITAIMARYQASSRTLTCLNAGHCSGIVQLPNGQKEMIASTGFPLGLFPQASWDLQRLELPQGAMLLLYTDGIVDRENSSGEYYEEKRLLEMLIKTAELSPSQVLQRIFDDNDQFGKGIPMTDDSTILVIRT